MREETGLVVDVGPVVEVFDRILLDDDGRVRYHFVLVDYLCRPSGGTLAAGSDVGDGRARRVRPRSAAYRVDGQGPRRSIAARGSTMAPAARR